MNNIFETLTLLGYPTLLWLFTVAFAIHEAEEWNIMQWYRRNYSDLPPTTDRAARTWLVFISSVVFLWCALATLLPDFAITAFIFLPVVTLAYLNALQHLYWLLYFRQYAPGVITSVALLLPLGSYLLVRALQQNYVPVWYVSLLMLLVIRGLLQTSRAGNTITPEIRAVHNFSIRLAEWIG